MEIKYLKPTQLKEYGNNAKLHPDTQIKQIVRSIEMGGFYNPIIVDKNYTIICGHGRLLTAKEMNLKEVPCVVLDVDKDTADKIRLLDNKTQESGYDIEKLVSELQRFSDEIETTGYSQDELDTLLIQLEEQIGQINTDIPDNNYDEEIEDEIPEDVETRVKSGDIWQLGRHLLLCGDCTIERNISELVSERKITLVHADPPYGMGKEKDGVENDNLYKEKLDAFQMQWIKTCRKYVKDNGSFYVWGNAEDLWRLWYCGGLKDSERLTFRNQIVWDKKHGQGMKSAEFRMYPTVTEHCLFFMLGEQIYQEWWDGWTEIRNYFLENKEKSGFTNKKINQILGTSDKGGGMASHYFTGDEKGEKKQWALPTEEMYKKLQSYCQQNEIDAFNKEYDELKKEWYATRAYFDNTHDLMTDVWQYQRVQGGERYGHPTPKPVAIIERIIKTSCPEKETCYEPFLGSGTTLIACEKTNRICIGSELSPKYCDVILQRWENLTGKEAIFLRNIDN